MIGEKNGMWIEVKEFHMKLKGKSYA